jgi:hypothetical protein
MSRRNGANTVSFVEKSGTGMPFASANGTEIRYSFSWANPDYDRTESQTTGKQPASIENVGSERAIPEPTHHLTAYEPSGH